MAINVSEITSVLKREISAFENKLQVSEVGTVVEVGDGIARIYGLSGAMSGELLEFENGAMGQVFNLEEDSIGAVVYGNYLGIKEGDSVKSTGRLLEVPVGPNVIGRVVNPLDKLDAYVTGELSDAEADAFEEAMFDHADDPALAIVDAIQRHGPRLVEHGTWEIRFASGQHGVRHSPLRVFLYRRLSMRARSVEIARFEQRQAVPELGPRGSGIGTRRRGQADRDSGNGGDRRPADQGALEYGLHGPVPRHGGRSS